MSLKSQFKSNSALAKAGAWFDLAVNSDGSKARIRLRRSGRSNPTWGVVFRERSKGIDVDNLTTEQDNVFMAGVLAEACVAEWENIQPDDDGKNLEFSIANAEALLSNPDWLDLLSDLQAKAAGITEFQDKVRDAEAKN